MNKAKLAMMAALLTLLEDDKLAAVWREKTKRQQDAIKNRMEQAITMAITDRESHV